MKTFIKTELTNNSKKLGQSDNITKIVYESADEVNENRPDKPPIIKSPSTILFGKKSRLDSLGLVSLIVIIEQKLEEQLGVIITIADERAMSQPSSPFKTIESLVNYINMLLDEINSQSKT